MHRHVCTNMLLPFNLMKFFILSYFMCTKIPTQIFLALFSKIQILGCYNSTLLKMNLVPEIRKTLTKRQGYFVFGFFYTSSCSSIFLIRIPLYFVYLLTLLQVSCQTDSKILTDTPNNTQVTPITKPPFLEYQFSSKYPPSDEVLTNLLVRRRFYYQSSKH